MSAGHRRSRSGFTFVELLIAATMMSVLFIGLGSHLRGGLVVWRQTTQSVDALQRQRVALDRLARDLAHAVTFEETRTDKPLPPQAFGATALQWFTVQSSGRQRDAVRVVTYRCEVSADTPGLWRTRQSIGEAREALEPSRELVLSGCETLRLRYAYQSAEDAAVLEWRDGWDDAEQLPRLIEVTVRLISGREVRRLMVIPHGIVKSIEAS